MEHGKAVVVLAGHHKILHAARLGETHPRVRVKADRIERLGELLVFGVRNRKIRLNPLRVRAAETAAPFACQKGV